MEAKSYCDENRFERLKKSQFILIIISIIGSALLFNKFSLWSQILVQQSESAIVNSHTIRILTTRFLIEIPKFMFGTSDEISFNIICLLAIIMNARLLKSISRELSLNDYNVMTLYCLPFILGAFQNGRGVFLNLTITILTYLVLINQNFVKQILLFLLAFLLANFSSGVYFGFSLTYLMLCITLKNQFIFKRINGLLFLLVNIPLMKIYYQKNIDFYDGSLIKMLNHGVLSLLTDYSYFNIPIIIIVFTLILLISVTLIYKFKKKINTFLSIFNLNAFVMLMFGFSAFLAFTPTLFLQTLYLINADKNKVHR